MRVVITVFALNEIEAIHRYYEKRASKSIADKLTDRIFDAIESLEYAAHAGSIEPIIKAISF